MRGDIEDLFCEWLASPEGKAVSAGREYSSDLEVFCLCLKAAYTSGAIAQNDYILRCLQEHHVD